MLTEQSRVPQATRQGFVQWPWRHICFVVPQSASLRHDVRVVVVVGVEGEVVSVSVAKYGNGIREM